MPDWSYQTLFRPLLFQLPARAARDLTLHAMGTLSRLPGGSLVIKTLGHMESSPILHSTLAGIPVKYPVGLSGGLDPRGTAHRALAQFGFGFIEIGPVSLQETVSKLPFERDLQREAIVYPADEVNEGLEKTVSTLQKKQGHSLPLMLRIRSTSGLQRDDAAAEQRHMMEKLSPYAAAFYIELPDSSLSVEEAASYVEAVRQAASSLPEVKPMLLYMPLDEPMDRLEQLLPRLRLGGWSGIVIGQAVKTDEGYVIGKEGMPLSRGKVSLVRRLFGSEMPVIASGGVHQPQDALDLMQAGATYVQLHSGLVYAGPGLPKRINGGVIYKKIREQEAPADPSFWFNWG